MDWTAFGPLILPYATTCSAPLMEQHARLAAIDFFKHTQAWQVELAALAGNGVLTSFAMVLPDDAEVEKLMAVEVTDQYGNKTDASLKTAALGSRLSRSPSNEILAYTADRANLTVKPAQATGVTMVATVALKPTLMAATLPDQLFSQYGQAIANGALAKLTSMANKPWTDDTAARINGAEFINAKAVIARQVERGFAKSGRRPATRWF